MIDDLTDKDLSLYLRYDAYNDVFERKSSLQSSASTFLKKIFGTRVLYGNREFVYSNYKDDTEKLVSGYIESLGNYSDKIFYAVHKKDLVLPEKAPNPQVKDRAGRIRDRMYYLMKDSRGFKEVDINRRKIYDYFPSEKRNVIKSLLKEKKYKFKNSGELKSFIEELSIKK